MSDKYRITICVPCFGRPQRTRRIIKNILDQSISNWEAFVIGDGCPHFQEMVDSGEAAEFIRIAESKGSKLHCYNLDKNYGGFGYHITNMVTEQCKGEFLIYAGNDDIISPDHFEHYLSEIEGTDLDMVYYKTFVGPTNSVRNPILKISCIGHSEIILRSTVAKKTSHGPKYAHDWHIIDSILNSGCKAKKAASDRITYTVTHLPGRTIDTID
jgi:hypothetical protein